MGADEAPTIPFQTFLLDQNFGDSECAGSVQFTVAESPTKTHSLDHQYTAIAHLDCESHRWQISSSKQKTSSKDENLVSRAHKLFG